MQSLINLKLDLQRFKKCTEKGVKDMCMTLSTFKNLQKFNLTVMGIKISDQNKKDIKNSMKHVQNFHML